MNTATELYGYLTNLQISSIYRTTAYDTTYVVASTCLKNEEEKRRQSRKTLASKIMWHAENPVTAKNIFKSRRTCAFKAGKKNTML